MGSVSSNSATLEPYSAHYIDTYLESRRLIVVDAPTEDSVGKWWQMVWDEDIAYVVNLTPQDEEVGVALVLCKEMDIIKHCSIGVKFSVVGVALGCCRTV